MQRGLLLFLGMFGYIASVYSGTPFHIGVLDTGIVENDSIGLSRTLSQLCLSASDITDGPYYSRLSTCQNKSSTSFSAKVPRRYSWTFAQIEGTSIVNEVAGDRHGSDVLRAIRTIEPTINYIVANTSICLRSFNVGNPNCGILFPGGGYNLGRSSDITHRSIASSTFSSLLAKSSRLGAINVSYGDRNYSSCPTNLDTTFFELKTIHKAPVIAASGNGGDKTKPAFPACAPDVISVASTQRQSGPLPAVVSSTAVWDANTDFFAEGYFVPYDGAVDHDLDGVPNEREVGSSFAAPRVAAAFAILRGEDALASIVEIKQALVSASFDLGLDVNACRPNGNCQKFPFVNKNVIDRATEIVNQNSTVPVEPEPIEIDIKLPSLFGWDYQSTRNKFGVALQFNVASSFVRKANSFGKRLNKKTGNNLPQNKTIESYRLQFEAYDIDYAGELKIYINGVFAAAVEKGKNNLFESYDIALPVAEFFDGGNTIEFRVDQAPQTWALKNLLLKEIESATDQQPAEEQLVLSEGPFGDAFGEDRDTSVEESFEITELEPTPATYKTKNVKRDIRIKFTTRYDATNSSNLNRTFVEVNGQQQLATPSSNNTSEISHDYIVSGRELQIGTNMVEFRPENTSASKLWGIKDVSIEYVEPISLNVETEDNTRYGYNQTPTRFTSLRANFDLATTGQDYGLSVVGWDIDNTNEIGVFVNGNSLGPIQSTQSNGLNSGDIFFLDRSVLVDGNNQIEFVSQLPGSPIKSLAEWGVQNLSINLLRPDLRASDVNIENPALSISAPFTVTATVTNQGQTEAASTTMRFYVSSNEIITTSDTEVAATAVPSLAAGSSATINQNIQTTLVNQGLFLGVCVDAITSEINDENNCSDAIPLEGRLIITPILMLLFDDEPTPLPQ